MAEWKGVRAFVDVWLIDLATSASTSLLADEMVWGLMVDDSGPLGFGKPEGKPSFNLKYLNNVFILTAACNAGDVS